MSESYIITAYKRIVFFFGLSSFHIASEQVDVYRERVVLLLEKGEAACLVDARRASGRGLKIEFEFFYKGRRIAGDMKKAGLNSLHAVMTTFYNHHIEEVCGA
jgi:hypothetical protein